MPHTMTLDDLWSLPFLTSAVLSPDGRRVAYTIMTRDKAKNETQTAIFLLHLDKQGHLSDEPRRLTTGTKQNTQPVWSPDSHHLLFLSNREGDTNQLWLIDTDGGEARQVTTMLHGVSDAAWSHDGRWIAFTAPVAPDDEDDVLMGRKQLDEPTKKQREDEESVRLRTVNTIFYRLDGNGLFERFDQLFVMPAPSDDEKIDLASIRRLTSGSYGHEQPQWTPDDTEIGVLCNRNENRHHSFVSDLWTVNPETGEQRCLTDGTLSISCYSWSPDGNSVALAAAKDEIAYGRCVTRLYLVTRRGNVGDRTLELTPDLDRSTEPEFGGGFGAPAGYRPQWSRNGQYLYFVVSEQGCMNVYRLSVVWRTLTKLTTFEAATCYLALLPDEQSLLVVQGRADHPWELYRLPIIERGIDEVSTQEQLTHVYDDLMNELVLGKTERIQYVGANGEQVEGWLTLPPGARSGVRYPLLVMIHGGPHGAFGTGVEPIHQYCAAHGYAVFYCNPHGSSTYGEAFMRRVIGDWGGWDYEDIMRGVDVCIERGVADPERLVVSGYSYGGYMSMFIIGQTHRFKAAVPMAGISNLTSFVGTSDIGFWQVMEAKGYPWDVERAAYYRERSPLTYASRVTTPTLFLHPENDLRCPIEQSEQFYMTLKMMGKVPVEFVRVPQAWHVGSSKPGQRLEYYDKMLEWFGRYIEIRSEEYEQV